MSTIPENRQLGKKEADLFRNVIKFYESKQYKKGVKAADTILKKYPNHGETQGMKGLLLNSLGNKEEALELVKLFYQLKNQSFLYCTLLKCVSADAA